MKFKPGDVVKCVKNVPSGAYIKDATYIVKEIRGEVLYTVVDSLGSEINGFLSKYFELVDTTPKKKEKKSKEKKKDDNGWGSW